MSFHKKSQRPVEIYGICGPKGVGKDTLANLICESVRTTPFKIKSFAEPLKSQIARVFPITRESLDLRELKEVALPLPIRMDDYLNLMCHETGLRVMPRGLVANSRRELMQFYGTDYIRSVQDDYWIQLWQSSLHGLTRVIVPDVRFHNERTLIHALGGKVIQLSRSDVPYSTHESEAGLPSCDVDLQLNLVPQNLDILRRVARLITLGKFSLTHVFHWPAVERSIATYTAGASLETSAIHLGVNHKDPNTLKCILEYYSIPVRTSGGATRVPHIVVEGVLCKRCVTCKVYRPLNNFNASTKAWDNLSGRCKSCAVKYNKDRYAQYDSQLDWDKWLREVKTNASRRGLSCDLSVTDLKTLYETQGGLCQYSGRRMSFSKGDPNRVSVDRINSATHYTISNVVLCTVTVNKMKQDLSVQEFRTLAEEIVNHMCKEE